MQQDPVYAKTAKGAAEIAARSGVLSLPARRILIMIDGTRPVSALRPFVRAGEFEEILETLKAHGMIEQIALAPAAKADVDDEPAETLPIQRPAAPTLPQVQPRQPVSATKQSTSVAALPAAVRPPTVTPPRGSAAAAEALGSGRAPSIAPRSLEEGKRIAVRELYARLGPYGEAPAAKIQQCTTLEALREQIQHAFRRVATIRGPEEAQAYLEAVGFPAS
ncbi:MAG: hypothetical protein RMK97_07545 [Sutterellaceae bacterium]|nr:hypothetical protein [Burkholderiaceae bacterium]MCX7902408.1 hypothetical protein [Burkholderiaceae bacterium]MDW8430339.1 hypothetical protein [Sutterellaceae bacterium]